MRDHRFPLGRKGRGGGLLRSTIARYALAVATVGLALGLRHLLSPLTGAAASFVLFFSATLLTGLLAGVGPALCTLLLGVPIAAYMFVVRAGFPVSQALIQALLYAADGLIIVYLTFLMQRGRRGLEDANERLVRADEARERALARTREAIELAPDAYVLADLDARYIDVNQATCRLLGYERDELMEKTIFDIILPEDADRLRAVKDELLVPGKVANGEWTLRRKDGTLVTVDVSSNILSDGRWQAFMRDISQARRTADERKELLERERRALQQSESANAQLRESEERFRLTIEEAPIGMALVSLDGHFVRVNRALCEMTGYRSDELAKLTFQDITHPEDLDTDVALTRQLSLGEIPRYQLEKRYVRKDRSLVDVMLSASILRAPDGTPRYYIAQVEDITKRKRADSALRLSEAKFSGIVSIAADAIISVDEHQRITIFNEGAEGLFGYSKQEVIGSPLERLIPERLRAAHREHFARFAAGDEVARTMGERQDVFGLRKNGEEFPAEASISKVNVGGVMFFSVVLRDITERKNIETALQRAVTARDQVLGFVAHDLRNPLGTIVLQASAMERPAPEPERRDPKPREMIVRAAARMNRLIQDLLDVARVEAGQLTIEEAPLSVNDLVRDAVRLQETLAASAGLELKGEIAGDVGEITGDRDRLLQVFENLIGNAIKFTPKGGRITVRAVRKGQSVEFAVADTGTGIATDELPHVFAPFWQATTRAGHLGAGLGLPITKGIVEAHGGTIRVESAPGSGATFFFTIPAVPAEQDHRPSPGPTSHAASRTNVREKAPRQS